MSERSECRPIPAPEGWGRGVETAAEAVSDLVRLGLRGAAWPAMALPASLRGSFSRALRTAVQAAGILPHAVARGVDKFADDFAGPET